MIKDLLASTWTTNLGISQTKDATGDPSCVGPLAGVSLDLPVIHVLDERGAAQSAMETYLSVMVDALDAEALVAATITSESE